MFEVLVTVCSTGGVMACFSGIVEYGPACINAASKLELQSGCSYVLILCLSTGTTAQNLLQWLLLVVACKMLVQQTVHDLLLFEMLLLLHMLLLCATKVSWLTCSHHAYASCCTSMHILIDAT